MSHRMIIRSSQRIPFRLNVRLAFSSKNVVRPFHRYRDPVPLKLDQRNRMTNVFAPEQQIHRDKPPETGHELLLAGGFILQAHNRSGLFHYLPLGNRVLEKLERLADKHMYSIGGSKLSLSSFTETSLWQKSGRIGDGRELFAVKDRRDSGFLLSPTHEEEITVMLAKIAWSVKNLPLRLYQITRKYRDELRPRGGLLRTKEFIMKDMYTFDKTKEQALETYYDICCAYKRFFKELQVPFIVAEADPGNMGGKLNHEYHYESPLGEDTVWRCSSCDYAANDEVVRHGSKDYHDSPIHVWRGVSEDRTRNLYFVYPRRSEDGTDAEGSLTHLDIKILKEITPTLDTKVVKLNEQMRHDVIIKHPQISQDSLGKYIENITMKSAELISSEKDFTKTQENDPCPHCAKGSLYPTRTIEVGHTFFLGTRYSQAFALMTHEKSDEGLLQESLVQMGCYGIGISRLLAAIAETNKTKVKLPNTELTCLKWAPTIAPYSIAIIANSENFEDAEMLYDKIVNNPKLTKYDVLLDDRTVSIPWKMTDADLRGIPIIVVLGQSFKSSGKIEVQCRTLGRPKSGEGHAIIKMIQDYLAMLEKQPNKKL